MADASRTSNPPGWDDAFAALPLEAPPVSAWPAIAAQIDRKKARTHSRSWLALAASLFALAALPTAWLLRDAHDDADRSRTGPAVVATAPTRTVPTKTNPVPPIDPLPTTHDASNDATSILAAADALPPSTPDRHAIAHRNQRNTKRPTTTAHRPAVIDPTVIGDTAADVPETATAQAGDDVGLESLYATSAQLETLLAYTRDTRAESGPAAAMASELDAELATIDARLAQPDLQAQQQQALWQARVEVLRQATSFETNQRWLSAQGRRYDGALVHID